MIYLRLSSKFMYQMKKLHLLRQQSWGPTVTVAQTHWVVNSLVVDWVKAFHQNCSNYSRVVKRMWTKMYLHSNPQNDISPIHSRKSSFRSRSDKDEIEDYNVDLYTVSKTSSLFNVLREAWINALIVSYLCLLSFAHWLFVLYFVLSVSCSQHYEKLLWVASS